MTSPRYTALIVGYRLLFVASTLTCLGWLLGGAVITLADNSGPFATALQDLAQRGNGWARATLQSVPHSESLAQVVPDFAFSVLNLILAGVLLARRRGCWVTRLLALGAVGSAGAFNLQAHAAVGAAAQITGWRDVGSLHQVFLHYVSYLAFVAALLIFPTGHWAPASRFTARGAALLGFGVATLIGVGVGSMTLPHTVSCVLIFGVAVPLAGLAVLPRRLRQAPTNEQRTQARLAFSALLATFATTSVLAVVSLALIGLHTPGITLYDPTARMVGAPEGQPTTLLFWFARMAVAGIVLVLLEALRRNRIWTVERLCARGLAVLITVVLAGGGYLLIRAGTQRIGGGVLATILATAAAAGYLLPVYRRVEHTVDRVLYGRRPTPYRVLADVAALSGGSPEGGPNLAMAAAAIGRGLGASFCRLTVIRPGLTEGSYRWPAPSGTPQPEDDTVNAVVLPITQDNERIGSIAVDRGAVAGLHANRRTLLEDIAESLSPIIAASRTGIELERQLRATVAHARDIAASRQQTVAEMDNERQGIERNLHDGAQLHLVSLQALLGVLEHELIQHDLTQATERFEQLDKQLNETEQVLADTASGLSSKMLAERGLAAALVADLTDPDTPVTVAVPGLDEPQATQRIDTATSAAVYFCCLESVNNARKHAPNATVEVTVQVVRDTLTFTIHDNGPGFKQTNGKPGGRGQPNLRARINSVGGQLTIHSTLGIGTTVLGSVPLPPAMEQLRALLEAAARTCRDRPRRRRLDTLRAQLNELPSTSALTGAELAGAELARLRRQRTILLSLQQLVGSDELGALIEQTQLGMHTLPELELAGSLRAGTVPLSETDRIVAERLLGGEGRDPAARLGIQSDPTPEAVRREAERQLAHWQQLGGYPASTRAVRDAVEVLVRVCEDLLNGPGDG